MKILGIDTETTGLEGEIIQLSGFIAVDFQVKEIFDIKMRPSKLSTIDPDALKVNNLTIAEIVKWKERRSAFNEFLGILSRWIDKFDKNDKAFPFGYNVQFDLGMLNKLFLEHNDQYFGSWQNWAALDVMIMVNWVVAFGRIPFPASRKLKDVAASLGVMNTNWHSANDDIRATVDVYNAIVKDKTKQIHWKD